MTAHLPTIKQLQYLVSLKQHGHFGRAADACFVTQSTLSAGLRELENLLGITLVERTRRVVRFTPLGARIAEKALRVLRETEELTDLARAQGKPLHGELRLGVIPTILERKYGFDDFNDWFFAGGARKLGTGLWTWGDRTVIDGIMVNGTARLIGWFARVSRGLQTGFIYHYAFTMIIGVFGLLTLFWWHLYR